MKKIIPISTMRFTISMRQYLAVITIVLLTASCRKPDSLFEQLKEEDKLEAAYHFYPSTLRMLNFQNDTSINKLVKDVRKLSLLSMKPSAMNAEEIKEYAENLQADGQYELYVEIDAPENQCYILGDAKTEKTIALYGQQEHCYVVDITGKVDFMQLPKIYRAISERDSMTVDGFSMLFDAMKEDADNERRRRERRKEYEERKAKEEAEKMKRDSILLD